MEADQLTNEDFTGFDESLRIDAGWDDLQFKVLEDLVQTRESFVLEKARAKEMAARARRSGRRSLTNLLGNGYVL